MNTNKAGQSGFTLIEMMITVAILAIISAIAIPAYTKYVLRAHRSEAQSALLDIAAREERYLAQNNAYATTLTALNASSTTSGGYYSIAFSTDAGNTSSTAYKIVATAIGTQVQDTLCTSLSLDQSGARTATGSDTTQCWH